MSPEYAERQKEKILKLRMTLSDSAFDTNPLANAVDVALMYLSILFDDASMRQTKKRKAKRK